MIVQRKLLLECIVDECGHLFQAWTETHADGTWEAHFRAECPVCESVVESIRDLRFPTMPISRGD